MVGHGDDHRGRKISLGFVSQCMISLISAILAQLSLLLIPSFFPSFYFFFHLLFSAVLLVLVIGFGQFCRRLVGVRGSAPAFVFFHIVFIWIVYLSVIREAVSSSMDIILNGELVILLIGFVRMFVSDPGFVHHDSHDFVEGSVSENGAQSQTSLSSRRVRYCRSCKAHVRGFDHHCPAFGNCIGKMNYVLFVLLVAGFIVTESSYAACCYQWVKRYNLWSSGDKNFYESLAVSTMLFSLLQVIWQVVFLAWHIYCIFLNIRTDEWINWKRYPEFHVNLEPSPDKCSPELIFRNPYDKGIFYNLMDFLLGQGPCSANIAV